MILLETVKDKVIGVVGLARSGEATLDALIASGANIVAWDDHLQTRTKISDGRRNHITVEPPEQWQWDRVDLLVVSPGIPLTHPLPHPAVILAREHSVDIVGDVELFHRACPDATYVAITGTNGKSTTTALIDHILKEAGKPIQMGGNIGTPILALDPAGEGDIVVLELSSYQLDLVRSTVFDVAVLLNLSEDHIDRHGSFAGYIAAKRHIFDRHTKEHTAIIGADDAASKAILKEMQAMGKQTIIPIATTQSCEQGVSVTDGILHAHDGKGVNMYDMLTLQGRHNAQNAAAAYAVCRQVGVSHEAIIDGMRSFPGLAHRMQLLGEWQGIRFVNDSKATNADAAAQSLGTFDMIYWIAGGVAKEGGIAALEPYFSRIAHAYLIGQAQDDFAHTLHDKVAYHRCETLDKAFDRAVADAVASAEEEAVILLAPACASFDQFANFEIRGEAFIALYDALISQDNGVSAHAI